MHLPVHIPFFNHESSHKHSEKLSGNSGAHTDNPQDHTCVASFRNAGFFEYVGTLYELQRFDVNLVLAFPFGHPTDRSNDGHLVRFERFCEGTVGC